MSIPPPLTEFTIERFWNCWNCRVVACGGLLASGLYVFETARRRKLGRPWSLTTAIPMVIATGLITSGLVVIDERMGRQTSK